MSYDDEIYRLIKNGQAESSLNISSRHFEDAVKLAKKWENEGGGVKASGLASKALKELALNQSDSTQRTKYWRMAIKALDQTKREHPIVFAITYAFLCVDIYQDNYSSMTVTENIAILRKAREIVDKVLINCEDQDTSAQLLARKSSIIRHLSINENPESRLRMLQESYRCAKLAVERNREAVNILELAMSEWSLARQENSDEAYVARLSKAEELLLDKNCINLDSAQYALFRFYRLTYRYFETCDLFARVIANDTNKRRCLREAAIYGESASYLADSGYPEQVVKYHLERAKSILEMAVTAGIRDARTIVALAFIHGHSAGKEAGLTALEEICDQRGELSWNNILAVISEVQEGDLPLQGFALGIQSSISITRLGSFAKRFMENDKLAEALYRAAVRVDNREPISLTNLARLLVQRKEPAGLREAQRLVQMAQTFSDRRFRWWRDVLDELNSLNSSKINVPESDKQELSAIPLSKRQYKMRRQIRHRYNQIVKLGDAQQRGYELECIIYALAYLTFGIARASYRFDRPLVEKIHQVDGYFRHQGEKYRCECKWTTKTVGYDDVVKFADKLDVVGVSGLLVSISGFDEVAISKCEEIRGKKAIILMDGEEVDLLMKGILNFDEIMTIKRLYFDWRSINYYCTASKEMVKSYC